MALLWSCLLCADMASSGSGRYSSAQPLMRAESPGKGMYSRSLAELTQNNGLYLGLHSRFVKLLRAVFCDDASLRAPHAELAVGWRDDKLGLLAALLDALGEDHFAILLQHVMRDREMQLREPDSNRKALQTGSDTQSACGEA